MTDYTNVISLAPIVLLLILFFLCAFYSHKIKERRLRHATHFLLFSVVIYNFLIFLVYLPNLPQPTAEFISQLIFFTSHFCLLGILLFAHFFLCDTLKSKPMRQPLFWLFVAGNLALMVFSFTGHLCAGAEKVGSQYRPIPGPLRPYATAFYILLIIYAARFFWQGYRQTRFPFARRQIAFVGISIFSSYFGALIFNAIIPTFLRSSQYNFISQLCFVGLGYTFLYLYVSYQHSFVKRSLKSLLRLPFFKSVDNILNLERMLSIATDSLNNGNAATTKPMVERFQFQEQKSHARILYLSNELPPAVAQNSLQHHFPVQGYIETIERLERENLAMSLQVKTAADMFDEHFSRRESQLYKQMQAQIDTELRLTAKGDSLTPLEHSEKRAILKAYTKNRYSKVSTAEELGVSLNTLKSKILKYKLEKQQPPEFPPPAAQKLLA